jgi:hypothetical protein
MNSKQLIILLALVAVLGGAGLVLMSRNQDAWTATDAKVGQKLLGKFDINEVAEIHLVADGELTLIKKDDVWRVRDRGDYPANFESIGAFLIKLSDLKVSQVEPIEPAQLADLSLVEPKPGVKAGTNTASLIELKDSKGKPLQSVLLGIKHTQKRTRSYGGDMETPDGRFVMLHSDPKNVLLISDPLGDSDPRADFWLNKEFFRIEKPKAVAFTALEASNSWKLHTDSETNALAMTEVATNEVFDAGKIASIGATLGNPTFVDVATNTAPDQTGLDKPMVLNVDTFGHFNYVLKIGKRDAHNNYYMTVAVNADIPKERVAGKDEKPEDKTRLDKEFADKTKQLEQKLANEKKLEKWVYLVSSYSVEPLVRGRSHLYNEKKDPSAKEEQPITEDDAPDASAVPMNLQPVPAQ